MIRPDHNESVKFFTGTEVEHTPALGKKTLFVVGVQTVDDIAIHLLGCEHIYFGANQSFPNIRTNDAIQWQRWENMIQPFLDKDYLCTLDIDVQCVEGLLESGFTEHHNLHTPTGLQRHTQTGRQRLCCYQSRGVVSQCTQITKSCSIH